MDSTERAPARADGAGAPVDLAKTPEVKRQGCSKPAGASLSS